MSLCLPFRKGLQAPPWGSPLRVRDNHPRFSRGSHHYPLCGAMALRHRMSRYSSGALTSLSLCSGPPLLGVTFLQPFLGDLVRWAGHFCLRSGNYNLLPRWLRVEFFARVDKRGGPDSHGERDKIPPAKHDEGPPARHRHRGVALRRSGSPPDRPQSVNTANHPLVVTDASSGARSLHRRLANRLP